MEVGTIINFGTDYQFNTAIILGKGSCGTVFEGQRINRLQLGTREMPDNIAIKVITLSRKIEEA